MERVVGIVDFEVKILICVRIMGTQVYTVVYFKILGVRRCHLSGRQEKSWIKLKRDWNILRLFRGKQNRDYQLFNKKGKRNS